MKFAVCMMRGKDGLRLRKVRRFGELEIDCNSQSPRRLIAMDANGAVVLRLERPELTLIGADVIHISGYEVVWRRGIEETRYQEVALARPGSQDDAQDPGACKVTARRALFAEHEA